jgi:uncharacterized protein
LKKRINSLDFLRGIAVLGILIINIESFAFPAQFNPYLYGFETELDTTVRFWVYFIAQGKFFTMFVLLFGVSFYLMLERLQQQYDGAVSFNIYTRRLFILFLFGAIHAYFIWSGDVLHHYAICALLLLPVKSFSLKGLGLFILAMMVIIFASTYEKAQTRSLQKQAYQQAMTVAEDERTNAQLRAINRWESKLVKQSSQRFSSKEEARKGSYLDMLQSNWNDIKLYKGDLFFKVILFDCLMLMAIGILLYRLGIFADYRALSFYWPITALLFCLGLWMGNIKYLWWSYHYLNPITEFYQEFINKVGPYVQGVSYVLLLNGLYQSLPRLRKLTAINQVGKMALTSYIFHSIICALIFYGYGLKFHNALSRSEILGIVLAIWLVNICFCYLWLRSFKQGPLEYIWRKMAYKAA